MAYQFFNYAQSVSDAETIKGQRLRNRLAEMQNTDAQAKLNAQEKRRQIEAEFNNAPARIKALRDAGMTQEADQLQMHMWKMSETGLKVARSLAVGVTEENWKDFRQDAIGQMGMKPEWMPENYSADWINGRVKEAEDRVVTFKPETFTDPQTGKVMTQVTGRDKAGNIVGQRPAFPTDRAKPKAPGSTTTGAGALKAADVNAIGRQAERLYGGIYDPATGKVSGLDPQTAAKVQSIQERAEEIYAQGGLSHGQAVAKAARDAGITIPQLNQGADPLGIR